MQETGVRSLIWEDLEQLSLCATITDPVLESPGTTMTKAKGPGARALQEKPQQ